MLEYLHVKNLAVIEECELSFQPGLNILTGETGAGKSVLLGSINLALGARADREMIRNGSEEAYVELGFSINDEIKQKLFDMDISFDDDAVFISRKISQTKNIFKINGEAASSKQVKELASLLIDIHGQHEHQSLMSNERQRQMLDAFGGDNIETLSNLVSASYHKYEALKKEYDEALKLSEGREREISLLKYECDEIEAAALVPGEDEELEDNYRRMMSSEKLLGLTREAMDAVSSDRGSCVSSELSHAIQLIRKASVSDSSLNEMCDRLCEAEEIVGDFSISLSEYIDSLEFEPEEFEKTESRLNLINSLKARFGNSINQILAYYEEKIAELDKLSNLEEYLEKLSGKVEKALSEYKANATTLSAARKEISVRFSKELTDELMVLNFASVSFDASLITDEDTISAKGFDTVEFMISTNPGENRRPMKNVASGGELSRIMLGIKTLLAKEDHIDALFFDEIDAGISGRTAWEVSKKLSKLSKEHQVILITHLAQIAAMADCHYEILKTVENNRTYTSISKLDSDGEIRELARLLGSDVLDDAALKNAAELKEKAKAGKND